MKRARLRVRFTGLWFLVGPVLGCMWLAAVNYSNNLVYGVLYLVAALSFISFFHIWRNLASIEIEHVRVRPSFAGEGIEVQIHLRNGAAHSGYGVAFDRHDPSARAGRRRVALRVPGGGTVHLDAGDARTITVLLPALARGRHRFEELIVRSAYPFGIFVASFQVKVEAIHYVYPATVGSAILPPRQAAAREGPPTSTRAGDDFSGVRAYSPGESLRHVDWKAYARGRALMVKQFRGGEEGELWLDARSLAGLPLEKRLSQLALWAKEAEQAEISYGLNLSGVHVPPGLGSTHQRCILEMLAVAKST